MLDEIVQRRRVDVAAGARGGAPRHVQGQNRRAGAHPPRDPLGVLARPGLHLIAEIKRRSPSAGQLARDLDIAARARAYERGGASVVSVLVEPHYFGGSLDDLATVRRAVALPLLAKEFVVDPRQFDPLRVAGADLVLLIASAQPARALQGLVRQARDAGLEPLVETHDQRQLEHALATDARIIGINNRDLRTLDVDPGRAQRLRELHPGRPARGRGVRPPFAGRPRSAARHRLRRRPHRRGPDACGDEPRAVTALTHAFVEAGRPPAAAADLPGAGRTAAVKLCGITDERGALAAVAAGADAVGLNFVPGTKRCLTVEEGTAIAALVRTARPDRARPALVGVFADQPLDEVEGIVAAVGLERIQLSGSESVAEVARHATPVVKVLRIAADTSEDVAAAAIERGRAYLALPNVVGLLLDAHDPSVPGGTGRRVDIATAGRIALSLPVSLAGGLDPSNVAAALRTVPAIGVDVASGIELACFRHPPPCRTASERTAPVEGPLPRRALHEARPRRPYGPPHHRQPPHRRARRPGRRRSARSLGAGRGVRRTLRAGDAGRGAGRAGARLCAAPRRPAVLGARSGSSRRAMSAARRRSTAPTESLRPWSRPAAGSPAPSAST